MLTHTGTAWHRRPALLAPLPRHSVLTEPLAPRPSPLARSCGWQIPGFVYGILFGYFFFFNTFPVNMFLQYARVGRWRDYRFGEKGYIILSLASKSLLTWLVFGGTFQPNGGSGSR